MMTIALCMRNRPLPEEEELEDQLFAGTSEAEPGNEPYKKILPVKSSCYDNKAVISDEIKCFTCLKVIVIVVHLPVVTQELKLTALIG